MSTPCRMAFLVGVGFSVFHAPPRRAFDRVAQETVVIHTALLIDPTGHPVESNEGASKDEATAGLVRKINTRGFTPRQ